MPFCIIFFVLMLLYLVMFKKFNFKVSLIYLNIIIAIASIFAPEMIVSDTSQINILFLATILLLFINIAINFQVKNFWIITTLSTLLGYVYYTFINNEIFLSLDYSIWFALILSSIFILLFSQNRGNIYYFCYIFAFAIMVAEGIFWYKELQITDLNIINIYNLFSAIYLIGISANYITTKLKSWRLRHEKVK